MKDEREFEAVIATSPYLNQRRRSVAEVLAKRASRRWPRRIAHSELHGGKLSAHIIQGRAGEAFQRNVLRVAKREGWTLDDEAMMG